MPGDEKFMILNRMYLRDTNAALIVYDQTNADSIRVAETWVNELKENAPTEVVLSLAGTKLDLKNNAVQSQEGQAFARKHKIGVCMQVSSLSNENVDSLF